MGAEIIVAVITVLGSIAGVVISNVVQHKNTMAEMRKDMEVYAARNDEVVKELSEKVEIHNNYAREIPAIRERLNSCEKDIDEIKQDIKEINKKLDKINK